MQVHYDEGIANHIGPKPCAGMGTCVHFTPLPSNSWWQTMAGWQVLSRPSAAEGGGRRPAFTGLATQPYSATAAIEISRFPCKRLLRISKPGRSTRCAGHTPAGGNFRSR